MSAGDPLAPEDPQLAAADRAAADAAAVSLAALDRIIRRLRRECPWDREQDLSTIVPHTLEEAYELADAIQAGEDAKVLDELGDVLFQVNMLALMLQERGAGDLAAVAENAAAKLVRRHPHVFGEVIADSAGDVSRNWDAIKQTEPGRERGIFGEVPEALPGPLYARKLQRRAASSGFDFGDAGESLDILDQSLAGLRQAGSAEERFDAVGDLLFAAVNSARKLEVDPELALRASAGRFRARVQAAVSLAEADGQQWSALTVERQLAYYLRAL